VPLFPVKVKKNSRPVKKHLGKGFFKFVEFPKFLVAFFEKLWRVLVNSRFNNLRRIFLAEMKIPE